MGLVKNATTLSIPQAVLADLHVIKGQLSRTEERTVYLPEVMERIIAYWREGH
jgi:hypothetical protein